MQTADPQFANFFRVGVGYLETHLVQEGTMGTTGPPGASALSCWPPPGEPEPAATSTMDTAPETEQPDRTAQGVQVGGGWLRFWDSSEDAHYYYHSGTGETRWDAPEGQPGAAVPDAHGSASAAHAHPPAACDHPPAPGVPAVFSYHDGYDWDAYARTYGLPSGYHAYWEYYWGSAGTHCQPSSAQAVAPGAAGSIIYEPARAGAEEVDAQDAMARLDKILARQPGSEREEAHAVELARMEREREGSGHETSELTEAQKIFGTGDTFTNISTLELPSSESCSKYVNLESR